MLGRGKTGASRTLERASAARLASLRLPPGAELKDVASRLEELRGRRLFVRAAALPAEITGMWVVAPKRDYIFYGEGLAGCHCQQTVMHEFSHVMCEHRTGEAVRNYLLSRYPELDELGELEHVCMRSEVTTTDEHEAEMLASVFLTRLSGAADWVDLGDDDSRVVRERVERIFKS